MSLSELQALGRLEGKMDLLLEQFKLQQESSHRISSRVTSLEVTRTQQRAYWRSIVLIGGLALTILGKVAFFTSRVAVNLPIIPVK